MDDTINEWVGVRVVRSDRKDDELIEGETPFGEVTSKNGREVYVKWTYPGNNGVSATEGWMRESAIKPWPVPPTLEQRVAALEEALKPRDAEEKVDTRLAPEHIDWEARRTRETAASLLSGQSRGPLKIEDADALANWIMNGTPAEEAVSEQTAKEQEAFEARPERVGPGLFGTYQSEPAPEGMSTAHAVFWQKGRKHGDQKGYARGYASGAEQGKKAGRIDGMRELQKALSDRGLDVSKLVDELLYGEDDPE